MQTTSFKPVTTLSEVQSTSDVRHNSLVRRNDRQLSFDTDLTATAAPAPRNDSSDPKARVCEQCTARPRNPSRPIRVTVAMPFTRYDLRNADDRIAQVKTYVDRERARLDSLEPDSPDARWVGEVLAAMERTLRQFEEHRSRIAAEIEDR